MNVKLVHEILRGVIDIGINSGNEITPNNLSKHRWTSCQQDRQAIVTKFLQNSISIDKEEKIKIVYTR